MTQKITHLILLPSLKCRNDRFFISGGIVDLLPVSGIHVVIRLRLGDHTPVDVFKFDCSRRWVGAHWSYVLLPWLVFLENNSNISTPHSFCSRLTGVSSSSLRGAVLFTSFSRKVHFRGAWKVSFPLEKLKWGSYNFLR